jgi:hypothetical protein
MGRSPSPRTLSQPVLAALGDAVAASSDSDLAPLEIDLVAPNPPRLRLNLFSLLDGGRVRHTEFKINVRLPGGRDKEYSSFDYSRGRLPVLMAYHSGLATFVLWDAQMHRRVLHAGNMQVKKSTVEAAALHGWATQARRSGDSDLFEIVIACRPRHLLRALNRRLQWAGGLPEDQCPV